MRNIPVSGESEERIDRIVWTSSHLDIQHNLYIFRKGFIQFTSLDLSVYGILFPGKPTKKKQTFGNLFFTFKIHTPYLMELLKNISPDNYL